MNQNFKKFNVPWIMFRAGVLLLLDILRTTSDLDYSGFCTLRRGLSFCLPWLEYQSWQRRIGSRDHASFWWIDLCFSHGDSLPIPRCFSSRLSWDSRDRCPSHPPLLLCSMPLRRWQFLALVQYGYLHPLPPSDFFRCSDSGYFRCSDGGCFLCSGDDCVRCSGNEMDLFVGSCLPMKIFLFELLHAPNLYPSQTR